MKRASATNCLRKKKETKRKTKTTKHTHTHKPGKTNQKNKNAQQKRKQSGCEDSLHQPLSIGNRMGPSKIKDQYHAYFQKLLELPEWRSDQGARSKHHGSWVK